MKIVVVYESMYGNTKAVGEAIAAGLREGREVRIGTVDEIAPEEARDAALIVAGGPTHAHGMARPDAHEAVVKMDRHHKYGPVLPGSDSLRGWLDRLPPGAATAAAFDTRFDKPAWMTGSAAKKIAVRLSAAGIRSSALRVSSLPGWMVPSSRVSANVPLRGVDTWPRRSQPRSKPRTRRVERTEAMVCSRKSGAPA
jgi:flavodoxin-like protein